MLRSGIRYARSGDIDIAYEVYGDGPIDLVLVPGFVSHLDLGLEIPTTASALGNLTRYARVLMFDKRGTGLSDRELGFGSIAERADDIRAVMDAAGFERAHLYGISEGGPMAILYAATHPDRVKSLVLVGTMARALPADDYPATAVDPAQAAQFVDGMVAAWGTGDVLAAFLAGGRDDPRLTREVLGRFERSACTPKMVGEIMRRNLEIDVREFLPTITVPTLVMHAVGDNIVPVSLGRYLADHIAGARYVELPFEGHGGWDEEQSAPYRDTIAEFLTGTRPRAVSADRLLATVLFTDIVDSTRRAADVGDRRWRALLDEHDARAARVVDRYGGRVVKQTGDGMLATFDSPARGVQCAQELRESVAELAVPIRAGLHTGEIERRGDDVGGIGVHIAARVAALAAEGEVLVSRTVRDLTVGSDLRFDDRGAHELKGVPEAWQIYAAVG